MYSNIAALFFYVYSIKDFCGVARVPGLPYHLLKHGVNTNKTHEPQLINMHFILIGVT